MIFQFGLEPVLIQRIFIGFEAILKLKYDPSSSPLEVIQVYLQPDKKSSVVIYSIHINGLCIYFRHALVVKSAELHIITIAKTSSFFTLITLLLSYFLLFCYFKNL